MRCGKHGLATADDGLCVLCRREMRSLDAPPTVKATGAESSWVGPNLTLLAMLVVATAGFIGSRATVGLGITTPVPQRSLATEGDPRGDDGEVLGPDGERPDEAITDRSASLDSDREEYRAALERVEVNVYYASWCPACKTARAWLRSKNIPYEGFDVDRDPSAARRLRELNPRGSIPTIEIDGKVTVGFNESQLRAMLDAAVARHQQEL